MDWNELAGRLTGIAHIATADASGKPHAAIVMPGVEGDTVWIASNTGAGKTTNVRANGQVSLVWESNGEVYLNGLAAVVDDPATKQRIWSSGVMPYPMAEFFGTADSPKWVLLQVTPLHATVMLERDGKIARERWTAS